MRRTREYVKSFGGVIAQHSQDPELTEGSQMNERHCRDSWAWQDGRPSQEAIIARDILLAKHVGSRLHVCLSTAGSVSTLFRWGKAQGVNITAEGRPPPAARERFAEGPLFKVGPAVATLQTSKPCARAWPTARSAVGMTPHLSR